MAGTLADLNASTRLGWAAAEAHAPALERAWRAALRKQGRVAADRFVALQRGLVAAVDPNLGPKENRVAADFWSLPDIDELLDSIAVQDALGGDTEAALRRLARAAIGPGSEAIGLSPMARTKLEERLMRQMGRKIVDIGETTRQDVLAVLQDAYQQGFSIDKTAREIRQQMRDASVYRSKLIARTELVGVANGASLGLAHASGVVGVKVWITAGDDRVRDDHAAVDGQSVPIDEPFDVGGAAMMFPGDPAGPPDEVCNCRCTLGYSEAQVPGGDGEPEVAEGEEGAVAGEAGAEDVQEGTVESEDETATGFLTEDTSQEEDILVDVADDTAELDAGDVGAATDTVITAAGGVLSLPLGARDEPWLADAAAAVSGADELRATHFWCDPDGDPDAAASYRLPFASGGHAVWGGVTAAAAALEGGRGGIPEGDVAGVQAAIAAYYHAAAELYGDASILPPWEAATTREAMLAAAAAIPNRAEFRGAMRFVTADATAEGTATEWSGLLAPIGAATDDGRMLDPAEDGAISWRELPLALMAQFETAMGHDGAQVAGRIDNIAVEKVTVGDWTGFGFVGSGCFDDGAGSPPDASGREAARLCRDGALRGVSLDLAVDEVEMRTAENEPIAEDDEEAWLEAFFGNGIVAVTRGSIMGATMTPFPAFADAQVAVVASLHPRRPVKLRHAPARGTVLAAVEHSVEGRRVPMTLEKVQAAAVLVASGLASIDEARGMFGLAPLGAGTEGIEADPALVASLLGRR